MSIDRLPLTIGMKLNPQGVKNKRQIPVKMSPIRAFKIR